MTDPSSVIDSDARTPGSDADVRKKVRLSLDEARLLILGAQVLLGFQYRGFLESGFAQLPPLSRGLWTVVLGLMVVVTLLIMWPGSFHQIVERGNLTVRLLNFTTSTMDLALFPFAIALGIDVYIVTQRLDDVRLAVATGVATALAAIFFWYGVAFLARLSGKAKENSMKSAHPHKGSPTPLHEKIDTVLTECRVVIPGSQALLGFQFIAMLMDGFSRLPRTSQYAHLVGLLLIALSTIFLMAPAAYHRIVERGEDTERLWRYARSMLLAAMAALAAGLATEFFVVCRVVTNDARSSMILSAILFAVFALTWFGYTTYLRWRLRAG